MPKKTLDQLCEKVWEWEDKNKRIIVVNQILSNRIVFKVEKVEKIIKIRGELTRDILCITHGPGYPLVATKMGFITQR